MLVEAGSDATIRKLKCNRKKYNMYNIAPSPSPYSMRTRGKTARKEVIKLKYYNIEVSKQMYRIYVTRVKTILHIL